MIEERRSKFIGKTSIDGIPYGMYEYRGRTYEVCLNTFYSYKSLYEQHKEEQDSIDRDLSTTNSSLESYEKGFDLFWDSVN